MIDLTQEVLGGLVYCWGRQARPSLGRHIGPTACSARPRAGCTSVIAPLVQTSVQAQLFLWPSGVGSPGASVTPSPASFPV